MEEEQVVAVTGGKELGIKSVGVLSCLLDNALISRVDIVVLNLDDHLAVQRRRDEDIGETFVCRLLANWFFEERIILLNVIEQTRIEYAVELCLLCTHYLILLSTLQNCNDVRTRPL